MLSSQYFGLREDLSLILDLSPKENVILEIFSVV